MSQISVIVIGTHNRRKAREIGSLLDLSGIAWKCLADFPQLPQVVEDGASFAENARKKALGYAQALGQWVLAEDSGLEVEALQGQPGIHSARFAGPNATDRENIALLLEKLRGLPPEKRWARFVCCMVLADPRGTVRAEVQEFCRGRITEEPRGESGFGYDPVFEVVEYHRTFAELGPAVKNLISHRGRALRQILPQVRRSLGQQQARVHSGGEGCHPG